VGAAARIIIISRSRINPLLIMKRRMMI